MYISWVNKISYVLCLMYSLPGLRLQFHASIAKREDIRAILSLLFASHGEIFFMTSPSAMQRSTILPRDVPAVVHFSRGDSTTQQQLLTNGIE